MYEVFKARLLYEAAYSGGSQQTAPEQHGQRVVNEKLQSRSTRQARACMKTKRLNEARWDMFAPVITIDSVNDFTTWWNTNIKQQRHHHTILGFNRRVELNSRRTTGILRPRRSSSRRSRHPRPRQCTHTALHGGDASHWQSLHLWVRSSMPYD